MKTNKERNDETDSGSDYSIIAELKNIKCNLMI